MMMKIGLQSWKTFSWCEFVLNDSDILTFVGKATTLPYACKNVQLWLKPQARKEEVFVGEKCIFTQTFCMEFFYTLQKL